MDNNQKEIVERPIGVKIISIFYYICSLASAIYFLANIFLLIWISIKYPSFNTQNADPNLANIINIFAVPELSVFIFYLVISVILAVVFFVLARGLWKLKFWAKISSINLSIVVIIYSIYQIIRHSEILFVLIGAGFAMIIPHLTLNEKVKEAFNRIS